MIRSLLLALVLCSCFVWAQTTTNYIGTIGKSYSAHLRLERKGSTLRGAYYYDNVGIALLLEGSIDAKNRVQLSERDEKKHSTGTFNGVMKATEFSGTWKGKKNKGLAFVFRLDSTKSFNHIYTGVINTSYKVQMNLTRKGNELSGMYYYERTGLDIPLRGTIQDNGNIVMDEFDEDGGKQATFTGRLNADFSLSGTWAKPDDSKMPFLLGLYHRVLRHSKEFKNVGSVEVFSRIRTESSKNKKSTLTIEYPQIRGMKDYNLQKSINQRFLPLKSIGKSLDEEIRQTIEQTFQVQCNTDSILSIIEYMYWNEEGAAHPNHASGGTTLDLVSGKEIRFQDIFTTGASQQLSSLAEKKLRAMYNVENLEEVLFEKSLTVNDSTDFFITTAGISLTFDPYEIAAYALGDITIDFSWKEIAALLKPESPVQRLAKKYR